MAFPRMLRVPRRVLHESSIQTFRKENSQRCAAPLLAANFARRELRLGLGRGWSWAQ